MNTINSIKNVFFNFFKKIEKIEKIEYKEMIDDFVMVSKDINSPKSVKRHEISEESDESLFDEKFLRFKKYKRKQHKRKKL